MASSGLDELLRRLAAGDNRAVEELLPRIYAELRSLAGLYMRRERSGHSLQPTALVHEAYIRLLGSVGTGAEQSAAPPSEPAGSRYGGGDAGTDQCSAEVDRPTIGTAAQSHFLALAARAMRQVLVEHARARARQKRGGGAEHVPIRTDLGLVDGPDIDVLALHDALEELHASKPRAARAVELLYFGGLTAAEVAEVVGVSARTVERDLREAREWLRRHLEGRIPTSFARPRKDVEPAADEPPSHAAEGIPRRIGRYPILGELGAGGSGTVYLAQDPALGRRIALKRLSPEFAGDAAARERLRAEARALAALQHPNIATVFSLEADDVGHPFLTLEHVDGPSLLALRAGGPIPYARALELARQIAHALEAAAQVGIVHGDLTPANVLLSRDGRVKVVDFGLARHAHGGAPPRGADDASNLAKRSLDRPGESETSPEMGPASLVAGTPGYMSPEQSRGAGPSAAGDLWSFGCILYEMLSGEPAFPGETPWKRLLASREEEPQWGPLEASPFRRVLSLTRRCLSKTPSGRPSSIRSARRRIEVELMRARADRSTRPSRGPETSETTTRLPMPQDTFVGREEERARLEQALREHVLVSLVGPGGVGKTRLALEVAHGLEADGEDVVFVDLGRASSLDNAIIDAFGIQAAPTESFADAIEREIAGRQGVVVLDGCESHRERVVAFLSRHARRESRLRFLMTTRARLGLTREERLTLTPLPPGRAAELLRERAREARPELDLARSDHGEVSRICRALDGLPLALELAAARLRTVSLSDLAERVSDFRTLGSTRQDVTPRHRDLASLVAWSEQLLPLETQDLFHCLGVLAPGWDLEAVETLAEARRLPRWQVIERLTALIDHSLVVFDQGAPQESGPVRYRMLGSVAAYARAQCTDEAALERRAMDHYRERVERETKRIGGPETRTALARLEGDRPNWLRAIERARATGDLESGLRFVAALDRFWVVRGLAPEARHYADAFLELAAHHGEGEADTRLAPYLGHAWIVRGNLHLFAGDFAAAEGLYRRALGLGEAIGDVELASRSYHNLGGVFLHREQWDEAMEWFGRGTACDEAAGNLRGAAIGLSNMGLLAERRKDVAEAGERYRGALDLARRAGDERLIGILYNNLAGMAIALQRWEEAEEAVEASLELHARLGDAESAAAARIHRAVLHGRHEDFASARGELVEALRAYEASGNLVGLSRAVHSLTLLEERAGRLEVSTTALAFARRCIQKLGPGAHQSQLLAEVDACETRLRDALSGEVFARAWGRGMAISAGDLVAVAASNNEPAANARRGPANPD